MASHNPEQQRLMCIRKTDEHFMLAVSEPFAVGTDAYEELDMLATDVRELDGGSQVFIYPRSNFGFNGGSPKHEFRQFAWEAAKDIGNVALDTVLTPVHAKIQPHNFIPVA